jgi:UDPglucose 6-dehydrogenase
VRGKTFAVWGLAFKPNTDDMREASSRRLLAQLWEGGATVRAYDPEAMHESQRIFGERDDLVFCTARRGAAGRRCAGRGHRVEAVPQPRFPKLREQLKDAVVFDGRNLYEPADVEAAGLAYYGIGRGRSLHV